MKQPIRVPAIWVTNMDRGEDRVKYPVLKSCVRSAAVDTMFIIAPQAARPTTIPPCDAPAQPPIMKMASLPYDEANDQSVRPHPYALQKAKIGATMYITKM